MKEQNMTLDEKLAYVANYPVQSKLWDYATADFSKVEETFLGSAMDGVDLFVETGVSLDAQGVTTMYGHDKLIKNALYVCDTQAYIDKKNVLGMTYSELTNDAVIAGPFSSIEEILTDLACRYQESEGDDLWGGDDWRHDLSMKQYDADFPETVAAD
jgi:hypothetical protein